LWSGDIKTQTWKEGAIEAMATKKGGKKSAAKKGGAKKGAKKGGAKKAAKKR
jgi:hypothetical protein